MGKGRDNLLMIGTRGQDIDISDVFPHPSKGTCPFNFSKSWFLSQSLNNPFSQRKGYPQVHPSFARLEEFYSPLYILGLLLTHSWKVNQRPILDGLLQIRKIIDLPLLMDHHQGLRSHPWNFHHSDEFIGDSFLNLLIFGDF